MTECGSARWPGTPTCSPAPTPRGSSRCWRWRCSHVAHATIRNRGTTVGSIIHADAAAEMPAVLALLGGSVEVESSSGRRTIPADELFLGPLETSLHHDEIAVAAYFPALPSGAGVAFDEIARRHGDYAMCGVAALVRVEGGSVVEARTGYLSVNDTPQVVDLSGAARRRDRRRHPRGSGGGGPGPAGPRRRHPRHSCLPGTARSRAHQSCAPIGT